MQRLIDVLVHRVVRKGERAVMRMVVYLVVALLLVTAYAAGTYALALTLAGAYGPIIASLVVAGIALLVASAILVTIVIANRRERRRLRRAAEEIPVAMAMSPAILGMGHVASVIAISALSLYLNRRRHRRD